MVLDGYSHRLSWQATLSSKRTIIGNGCSPQKERDTSDSGTNVDAIAEKILYGTKRGFVASAKLSTSRATYCKVVYPTLSHFTTRKTTYPQRRLIFDGVNFRCSCKTSEVSLIKTPAIVRDNSPAGNLHYYSFYSHYLSPIVMPTDDPQRPSRHSRSEK